MARIGTFTEIAEAIMQTDTAQQRIAEINTAAESAKNAAVASVEGTKNSSITAIENKKAEGVTALNTLLEQIPESLPELQETVSELSAETSALEKENASLKKSIDVLYKINRNQTYDTIDVEQSGICDVESGSVAYSVDEVYGLSAQGSTNGYQLLPDTFPSSSEQINVERIGSHNYKITTLSEGLYRQSGIAYEKTIEAGTYKLHGNIVGEGGVIVRFYNGTTKVKEETIRSTFNVLDIVLAENCNKLNIVFLGSKATSVPTGSVTTISDVMLETGSVKHDYEPYTGGKPSPSPDYPQPITDVAKPVITVCGANLWDEEWEVGQISSTTGLNTSSSIGIRTKNHIAVEPNANYCITAVGETTGLTFKGRKYDKNKNYIGIFSVYYNSYFNTGNDCFYIRFSPQDTYGTVYKNNIAVLRGTNGAYEPYHSQTLTLPYTLRSVGDVHDSVEVGADGKAVLVQRVGTVDLGTLTWTRYKQNNDVYIFYNTFASMKKHTRVDEVRLLCTKYKKSDVVYSSMPDLTVSEWTASTQDTRYIYVRDDSYDNETSFKTAMNGVTLLYELATPITTDLTLDASITQLIDGDGNLSVIDENGNDVTYMVEFIRRLDEVEVTA